MAKIEYVTVRMGNGHVARKQLKAGLMDFRKVAHGAFYHEGDAPQCAQDIRMHFSDKCTKAGRFIEVFNHHHPWRRNFQQRIPPFPTVVVAVALHWGIRASDAGRGRIADSRRNFLKNAMQPGIGEAFVAEAYSESLDGAGHNATA